jgi:sterol desaturase/sphingolipid hydroxylase (fatty acid hydroxylase superfamily)
MPPNTLDRAPVNRRARRIPTWVSGAVILGAFAAIVIAETRRPLRPDKKEPKLRRNLRNLAVAGLSAATLQLLEKPVVEPLSRLVERRRWGLLQQVALPAWAETALAILLMDYTLYLWHVAAHRSAALWRFHKVHHVDLDMDASTALRFHFAEMAISVPYRAAQVALIGVAPRPLSIWQTLLFVSILFHHSDLRLPRALERRLVKLIVTPRMHGIHHSVIEAETNSNWSSGLTVWDWLHGTLRLDLLEEEMEIGVAAYRDPAEVTLPRLVEMPFTDARPSWLLPSGEQPRRACVSRKHERQQA